MGNKPTSRHNISTKLRSEKYHNVYFVKPRIKGEKKLWMGRIMINGLKKKKLFYSEREAALFIDKTLISFGMNPINILKRANA